MTALAAWPTAPAISPRSARIRSIGEAEGSVQRHPPPRESASGNCRTARRQPFTARLSASSAMRLYVGAPRGSRAARRSRIRPAERGRTQYIVTSRSRSSTSTFVPSRLSRAPPFMIRPHGPGGCTSPKRVRASEIDAHTVVDTHVPVTAFASGAGRARAADSHSLDTPDPAEDRALLGDPTIDSRGAREQ